MVRPIIGISGSHNVADRQMFVRENYMQSVLRAGGIPVLLPEIEDEETAKAILDRLDGLLLAGGGDVLRNGEPLIPAGISSLHTDLRRCLLCTDCTAARHLRQISG